MYINEHRLYQHIGRELRRRRLKLGMTQADLAEATDELRTSITNIEAGRQRPPVHVLYRLCSVLGLEPGDTLPRIADVSEQSGNRVRIEALDRTVPPLTAAFVQDILQNEERPKDDGSSR